MYSRKDLEELVRYVRSDDTDIWREDDLGKVVDKFLYDKGNFPCTEYEKPLTMNASESLWGFGGWLTSRDEVTTMSARHDASNIAEKIAKFIKENNLPDVRSDWDKLLKHPKN